MSQYDFGVIDPQVKTGSQLANDLNNWRNALNSSHSGNARPAYAAAGTVWIDLSTAPTCYLKMFDGTADVVILKFDNSTHTGGVIASALTTSFTPVGNISSTNVQAALQEVDTEKLPTTAITSYRNKIINGDFLLWQRSASQTSTGYASVDRWQAQGSGSTWQINRIINVIGGLTDSLFCLRNTVTSVAGSANFAALAQPIEDVRMLSGKTVTVSFTAQADAVKNLGVEFYQSFGTGGSPSGVIVGIGSQKVSLTNAMQRFILPPITIPSIAGKTIGTNEDSATFLRFWFDAGSSMNAQSGGVGQQSGTFYLADVQVEVSPVATPFERMNASEQVARCLRYFAFYPFAGYCTDAGGFTVSMQYAVSMRATPSIDVQSSTGIASSVRVSTSGTICTRQGPLSMVPNTPIGIGILFCSAGWSPALATGVVVDGYIIANAEL